MARARQKRLSGLAMLACATLGYAQLGCAMKGASPSASPEMEAPRDATSDAAGEASGADEPMMDLDQAALSFEQAEKDIGALLADASANLGDDAVAGAAASEDNESRSDNLKKEKRSADTLSEGKASRCSRACSALSSMKRSADRLCDLAGRDDPRCEDVSDRYTRANQRVTQSCTACSS
jgi:hypothetical protein